jgi:glycosyltransferase involved in cell wall biosynthesis
MPDSHLPLVSVVLPTFNGERYLAESIESVLGQTHSNLELIIVDDCSTDSTPEIAAHYAKQDNRVRVHRNATNQRLPRSLNIGFAMARGEYLTWTSDDNRYRPAALATMSRALCEKPDIGMVYCNMSIIDELGAAKSTYPVDEPGSLLRGNSIGACFMYRRQVYKTVGDYDPAVTFAEDYDYWLRISRNFLFARITTDLYEYRMHSQSLTSRERRQDIQAAADGALLKSLPKLKWAAEADRFQAYRSLTRRAWGRGNRRAALNAWAAYWKASPLDATRYLFNSARYLAVPHAATS